MTTSQRVALVTGASKGIGRAIALAFAKEDTNTVICSRSLADVQRVAGEIQTLGARALAVEADVSKEEDVNEMVKKAIDEFGRIDILVNNAAHVGFEFKYFQQSEVADWDAQINVTFKGVLYYCKAVIPHMLEQGGGRIINITSEGGKVRNPITSLYNACKSAVAMFSQCLAEELARYEILVNCVAPGLIQTRPSAEMRSSALPRLEKLVANIPLRRLGEPDDIANMVLFLASDKAKYITGQHFSVSGGMTMV